MTVRNNYEVFVERPCMRNFTQARQVHAADAPTPTQPFAITGTLAAAQVTGTIITLEASPDLKFVGDVGSGQVYLHLVRNVLTYSGSAEATFGDINEGDQIYYDLDTNNSMPTDVRLSTSPLADSGVANPRFGWAVLISEADVFPKGTDGVASTQSVGVMQSGAGGIV